MEATGPALRGGLFLLSRQLLAHPCDAAIEVGIGAHAEILEIDPFGRIGCAAIIWLESAPAERRQLSQLNPGWNWPLIVADGVLLDLHEAEHVAIAQQGLIPASSLGSPTEECLDGRRTDDTVAAAVIRLVPKPLWPQVDEEIRNYDQSILDWTPCQQLIGYPGPDPVLPTS